MQFVSRIHASTACLFRRHAWRVFWVAVLVAHLPACLSALGDALLGQPDALRLALLAVAQALFILKIFDVPWLHVRTTRRTLLAGACGVALLHATLLPLTQVRESVQLDPWYAVTALGAASATIALLPVARQLARRAGCALHERWRRLLPQLLDDRSDVLLPPRFLLLSRACLIARAPPPLHLA
jgi:hypothetical protein